MTLLVSDGVSFLQCCRTNCDISDSCTQRSDTCEAGELIVNAQSGDEDVTDKEGSVLLTCCKVDSYKKGKGESLRVLTFVSGFRKMIC